MGGKDTKKPALVVYITHKYTEDELKAKNIEIFPKYIDSDKYGKIDVDLQQQFLTY